MWDPRDYANQFGDHLTNGLGHKWADLGDGVQGILVPGKRVFKIKRARVLSAEIHQVADQGDFQLGPGQLEQAMTDIAAGFIAERATGVSLSDLVPQRESAASIASTGIAPAQSTPPPGASCSSSQNPFGSMMSFFSHMTPGQSTPAQQGNQKTPRRQQVSRPYTPPQAPPVESPDKSSGAGGGSCGSAQRGRGRPREDVGSRAEKLFQEFVMAEKSHVRFFGSERKTQLKALYRLIEDLTKAEGETQDEAQVTRLVIMRKKVSATMNLCKAFHKQSGFLEGYNEVFMFAALPPKVEDVPCPAWMRQHAHRLRAQVAAAPNLFWALVMDTALHQAKFQDSEYALVQVQLIADRCIDIVRHDDGEVRGRLRDLLAPDILSHFEIKDDLRHKCTPTYNVSIFDSPALTLDIMEASIKQMEDPGDSIGSAVLTFPAGRAMIDAAKKHLNTLKAERCVVHIITGHVETLGAALPDDGHAIDWTVLGAAWKVCDAKLFSEDFLGKAPVVEKVPKPKHMIIRTWWPPP